MVLGGETRGEPRIKAAGIKASREKVKSRGTPDERDSLFMKGRKIARQRYTPAPKLLNLTMAHRSMLRQEAVKPKRVQALCRGYPWSLTRYRVRFARPGRRLGEGVDSGMGSVRGRNMESTIQLQPHWEDTQGARCRWHVFGWLQTAVASPADDNLLPYVDVSRQHWPAVVLGRWLMTPRRRPAAAMAPSPPASAVDAWRMANTTVSYRLRDASLRARRWWLNTALGRHIGNRCRALQRRRRRPYEELVENKETETHPLSVCRARCHHPHASNFRPFEALRFRGVERMKFLPSRQKQHRPHGNLDPFILEPGLFGTWAAKYGSR
ncbi:hypothetical protein SVAN01_01364 [Stagonosporopsis vannaccii]|nr:hypothetical protein SVAN01_01364 [Stagonosporopsis vannaccii]